jgi:hypothetical protein
VAAADAAATAAVAADVAAVVADAAVTAAAVVEIAAAAVAVAEAVGNFQLITEIIKSVFGCRLKTLFYFKTQIIEKLTSLISAVKFPLDFCLLQNKTSGNKRFFANWKSVLFYFHYEKYIFEFGARFRICGCGFCSDGKTKNEI